MDYDLKNGLDNKNELFGRTQQFYEVKDAGLIDGNGLLGFFNALFKVLV